MLRHLNARMQATPMVPYPRLRAQPLFRSVFGSALIAIATMGIQTHPAFSAKRELLVDVPDTAKDLYIEVGKRWSGEGMRGREGRIFSGAKQKKELFYVVATCSINGEGNRQLPVREISISKSKFDDDIQYVNLDTEPIRMLVLAHRRLCR